MSTMEKRVEALEEAAGQGKEKRVIGWQGKEHAIVCGKRFDRQEGEEDEALRERATEAMAAELGTKDLCVLWVRWIEEA